jgi:hypothetical protein
MLCLYCFHPKIPARPEESRRISENKFFFSILFLPILLDQRRIRVSHMKGHRGSRHRLRNRHIGAATSPEQGYQSRDRRIAGE